MKAVLLLDTGPLVAWLNRRDRHHEWSAQQLDNLPPPLLTCEAVLAEACHLSRRLPGAREAILDLVQRGLIQVPFRLAEHAGTVASLLKRYANVPMSLADACLVRMAELHANSTVLTLDSDFRVYRRHGRRAVPVRMPVP